MTHHHKLLPLLIGTVMGVMMPLMLHSTGGGVALIGFVLLHVLAAGAAALVAIFALKSKWAKALLRHRPSAAHLGLMAGGMALGFALLHMAAHGLTLHVI